MSQAITKTINLQTVLDEARQETILMMQQGIDISDSAIVTPLELIANQYPEIAFDCNESLMKLVKDQIKILNQQQSPQIINEF